MSNYAWNELKNIKTSTTVPLIEPVGTVLDSIAGRNTQAVSGAQKLTGTSCKNTFQKSASETQKNHDLREESQELSASRTHDRIGWRPCSAAEGPALWATPLMSWRPWPSWGAGGGARCTAAGLWYHTAWGKGLKSNVYTDYVSLRRQQDSSGGRLHRFETSGLNNPETSWADYSHNNDYFVY